VDLSKLFAHNQNKPRNNSCMNIQAQKQLEASKAAAANLRATHFTLGDNKTDFKTQSGFSHVAYTVPENCASNRA